MKVNLGRNEKMDVFTVNRSWLETAVRDMNTKVDWHDSRVVGIEEKDDDYFFVLVVHTGNGYRETEWRTRYRDLA